MPRQYTRFSFTPAVRKASRRGDPASCLISTAGRMQYGGDWNTGAESAVATDASGGEHVYRHTAGSLAKMLAFDAGLPVSGTAKMRKVRGPRQKMPVWGPKKGIPQVHTRAQGHKGATAAAGAGLASLVLILTGLWWVVLIAGLAGTAGTGVLVYRARTGKAKAKAVGERVSGLPKPGRHPSFRELQDGTRVPRHERVFTHDRGELPPLSVHWAPEPEPEAEAAPEAVPEPPRARPVPWPGGPVSHRPAAPQTAPEPAREQVRA